MNARKLLTTIGAGVTSFLLVSVSIIELLNIEFSAIVGLPVGLLVGVAVSVGLWIRGDELSLGIRRALTAYAAFGIALLVFLALRYVHIGRSVLTLEAIVGGSLAAVVIVYGTLFFHDRNRS
ncbi:hypothetical protein DQW50_17010 [Halorubrum sp. 48-1-W]|uniref:hypothetical protein n=1 Tax=Halorubrum sp. 48-1-W TaxID=2249761 RepID=UPI000DCD9812|nr:hypothetical protein [Halorubrum sp. 48-1-W]RAW43930.1 hypothetical protein DQW50_17010 [Halorubrum sp. 48-1-W]